MHAQVFCALPANLAYSGLYAVDYRMSPVIFSITWHDVCHIVIAVAVLPEAIMVELAVFESLRLLFLPSK